MNSTPTKEILTPIYICQKPSPKINKRSNNKTLVYKGKLMEIPKYDRNLCANSGTLKC